MISSSLKTQDQSPTINEIADIFKQAILNATGRKPSHSLCRKYAHQVANLYEPQRCSTKESLEWKEIVGWESVLIENTQKASKITKGLLFSSSFDPKDIRAVFFRDLWEALSAAVSAQIYTWDLDEFLKNDKHRLYKTFFSDAYVRILKGVSLNSISEYAIDQPGSVSEAITRAIRCQAKALEPFLSDLKPLTEF